MEKVELTTVLNSWHIIIVKEPLSFYSIIFSHFMLHPYSIYMKFKTGKVTRAGGPVVFLVMLEFFICVVV